MNKAINDLKKTLPSENILLKPEERYAYAFDASSVPEIKKIPDAVVFVENKEEVQKIVQIANKYSLPIVCRGAGTNTVGACIAEHGGIVLNFSKMNKILEINPDNMTARVEPGVVVGVLQKEVEKYGLYYPPDPSNLAVSTIGGSIAQNSAGARSFKYGVTKDYVIELTLVTAKGEIIKTGSNTIKNAAGYNLTSLFVGSEGTLAIVVEAALKLIVKPQSSRMVLAYFNSLQDTTKAVKSIIEHKILPATLDFMDKKALQTVEQYCPAGFITDKEAVLIIEVDGYENSVDEQECKIVDILGSSNACFIQRFSSEHDVDKIWQARRSSMAACAQLKPNVTTDDVVVPRENLPLLVDGVRKICEKYGLVACLIGHVGDGSIHPQIPIDITNKEECQNYKIAKGEIYSLAAKLGGTISGEHGIGSLKREYLPCVVSDQTLNYMHLIKKIFDPNNILNPYKIF